MPITYTYNAKIRPGGKNPTIDVTIQAGNRGDAQRLLEAQYGKGNVSYLNNGTRVS